MTMAKAAKIANHPQRGVGSKCTFRAFGLSTTSNLTAALLTTGVKKYASAADKLIMYKGRKCHFSTKKWRVAGNSSIIAEIPTNTIIALFFNFTLHEGNDKTLLYLV